MCTEATKPIERTVPSWVILLFIGIANLGIGFLIARYFY